MTSKEWAQNCLFYTSEILLDAQTPGAVAKERLIRNAKTLKECCEVFCAAMNWTPDQLLRESWKAHRGSLSQAKAQEQGKGLKRPMTRT
jgi:hypothetical protein